MCFIKSYKVPHLLLPVEHLKKKNKKKIFNRKKERSLSRGVYIEEKCWGNENFMKVPLEEKARATYINRLTISLV